MYYCCSLKPAYCGNCSVADSCAEKNKQVAVVNSVVCTLYAMHTYHSVEQIIIGRHTAHTHHRINYGDIRNMHKLAEKVLSPCCEDSSACADKRLFAFFNSGYGTLYLKLVALYARLVGTDIDRFGILEIYLCLLYVKRHINKHRSRSARACNVKCVFKYDGNFIGIFYKIAVLYKRLCRACDICLLEYIPAYLLTADLTGYYNHRYAVHIGCCYCGNKVCRTGTRCSYRYRRLSCHTGIAVCRMTAVSFVTNKHMAYLRVDKFIIKRTYSGTRITENRFYALRLENFNHSSCNRHSFGRHLSTYPFFSCLKTVF